MDHGRRGRRHNAVADALDQSYDAPCGLPPGGCEGIQERGRQHLRDRPSLVGEALPAEEADGRASGGAVGADAKHQRNWFETAVIADAEYTTSILLLGIAGKYEGNS